MTTDTLPDNRLSLSDATAGESLGRDAWRRLKQNRAAMVSLILLVVIAVTCLIGPYLLP